MRKQFAIAAFALGLSACAAVPPRGTPGLLDFLLDGRTTSEELFLHLGPPARQFENGRIATWRLDQDAGGYFLVGNASSWQGVRYELVVVFDAERRVVRHALIEVRSP